MDVITYLCFGQSRSAIDQPDFRDPLVDAMHHSQSIFPAFFNFKWFRAMITGMPPEMSKKMAPQTAGLVNMQLVSSFGVARIPRASSS